MKPSDRQRSCCVGLRQICRVNDYCRSQVYFGIAGWSYPDWTGTVYPPGVKDKLAYVARFVDLIEINSTFYRPPSARDSASWLQSVSAYPGFYFTAKLHQDISRRAAALAESAQSLTVVANNHYQGKEVANILQLKSLMTRSNVPVPAPLLGRYPDLKAIALPES